MKKRKTSTRRRKALRWLALLVFLAACMADPMLDYFLPSRTIREAEREGNIGPTRLLAELPGMENRTLRGNEKGLMLCTLHKYGLLGDWRMAEQPQYLDCTGPEPLYTGLDAYIGEGDGESVWLADWYGRIDCPQAAAVRLEVYRDGVCRDIRTVERADWMEPDGTTFFVLEFRWELLTDGLLRCQLLDDAGNVLYTQEQAWDIY